MFLKNKNIIFKIGRSKVTDYAALTIFILIDFPMYVGKISMELPILYFNESQVELSH